MKNSIGELFSDQLKWAWMEQYWGERIVGFLFGYVEMNFNNWERAKTHWPKIQTILKDNTGLEFELFNNKIYVYFDEQYMDEHPLQMDISLYKRPAPSQTGIRKLLINLKDEPDTTGMTAQEIIKEIRRRQQE